jgi:hypothetical protein
MPRLGANGSKLSAGQFKQFYEATLDAYDDVAGLDRAVRFSKGGALATVVNTADSIPNIVQYLIGRADTDGWSAELLSTMRAAHPENMKLLVFAQQFQLSPETPPASALQLLIKEGDPLFDVVAWRTALGRAEAQVCRIEQDDVDGIGTGFLLGPGVVMTNYHLVEEVLGGFVKAERIGLRFDYKILSDGIVVNPGQVYRLAQDWDIAHSPYSDLDEEVDAVEVPGTDKLDYALLRVDGSPGADPTTGSSGADPTAPSRGFVPVPPGPHDWKTRKGLMILQHPDGLPLKLAMRSDAVTDVRSPNGTPTRVRYSTRTEPGSSGSPCFDGQWNLVALHHSGDPRYAPQGHQGTASPQ